MKTIITRAKAPTPLFFRKLRNIGLALAAAGATVLAAPVALPVIVITIAGYAVTIGSVISAVSQVTVKRDI